MAIKRIKPLKPLAAKEHGGACPTCGHCKCCEKAAKPAVTFPICTRPHYPQPDWTWRPSVWYGTTATDPKLTIGDNTSSVGHVGHIQ